MGIFRGLPSKSLQPDLSSLNAEISVCEKSALWEFAFGLLQEVAQWALDADVISCDAAISACEKGM